MPTAKTKRVVSLSNILVLVLAGCIIGAILTRLAILAIALFVAESVNVWSVVVSLVAIIVYIFLVWLYARLIQLEALDYGYDIADTISDAIVGGELEQARLEALVAEHNEKVRKFRLPTWLR